MFRNEFHTLEGLQISTLIDTHSFVLQSHYGTILPTEQVPRSYPYHIKRKKPTADEIRIAETIKNFKIKQALKEAQKMLAFDSLEDKKHFLEYCKKQGYNK